MMEDSQDSKQVDVGAFGVNYALRPHKFVDRRVFVEVLNRYSGFNPLNQHVYVGLGSFAMEDHKMINASFGIKTLISLEIDPDVLKRQIFNVPLTCIKPTSYSTADFIVKRDAIFRDVKVDPSSRSIIWFDMTDLESIRAHLNAFGDLIRGSEPGDVIRITVDVDAKTLARKRDDETLDESQRRQFDALRELLGEQLQPGASPKDIGKPLGISRLVLYAFELVAEDASRLGNWKFIPLSLTTYADGHRMLSVTGAVVEEAKAQTCLDHMDLGSVPGGATGWDNLVNIQIPQLTVWEKLSIDRKINSVAPKKLAADEIQFRLHETISTVKLLEGYQTFQRFYPTFRHVLL